MLLARAGGMCERCKTARARQLHEIVRRGTTPKDDRRSVLWHPGNTLYLCERCHAEVHSMKQEVLGELMLDLRGIDVLKEFAVLFRENFKQQHPYIEYIICF